MLLFAELVAGIRCTLSSRHHPGPLCLKLPLPSFPSYGFPYDLRELRTLLVKPDHKHYNMNSCKQGIVTAFLKAKSPVSRIPSDSLWTLREHLLNK